MIRPGDRTPLLALVVLAAIVAGCTAAPPHRAARTAAVDPGMSVDWALAGRATSSGAATTSGPGGSPAPGSASSAASAIDGDAGTQWCPGSSTGTLAVDLGRGRTLDGLGLTLGTASTPGGGQPSGPGGRQPGGPGGQPASTAGTPATVSIQLGSAAGHWRAVTAARHLTVDPADPAYLTLPGGTTARYARLTVHSATATPACIAEFRIFGPDREASAMGLGADLSFTPQELTAGGTFTYHGRRQSPITIMKENGANYVRMRLWVSPAQGRTGPASDLALARQVHAAGMRIYLDIMYSRSWTDAKGQSTPPAWRGQKLARLAATVRSYTQQVISAFAKQGTPAGMVSIGNEIRHGILWPAGRVKDPSSPADYGNLATLLKAGVAGARAGNPAGHQLLVMIHYDESGNTAHTQAFFQDLVSRGVPFDVIGLSYYPFYDGSLSQLRANVDALATQFHKKIVIAETQYPWTLANGDSTANSVSQASQLPAGYPASAGGQLSLVSDELSIMAQIPDGLGAGLFYWAPDWIPGVGATSATGDTDDNLTLFTFHGAALPSIGIFRNPAAVCTGDHPGQVPCVLGS